MAVKLVGKLQDETIFLKKGYDEEPFEFKIDEGKNHFANQLHTYIFCTASLIV